MIQLTPVLTPHGTLVLIEADDGCVLDEDRSLRSNAPSHGEADTGCSRSVRTMPGRFSRRHCPGGGISARSSPPPFAPPRAVERNGAAPRPPAPDPTELARLADTPPIMTGAEYLSADVLASLWRDMGQAFNTELADAGCPLQEFLKRRNPVWNW